MASREAQGWQISVIIFAILTLVLSVSTYLFYQQSQTNLKEKEVAAKSLADKTKELNETLYRLQAHKYVLGLAESDAVTAAKGAAGGLDDPAINDLLKKYDEDMAMFPSVAKGTLNYRTLQDQFLGAIRDRNGQLVDGQSREKALETAKNSITAAAANNVKTATDGQQAAAADLETERTKFNDSRTQLEKKETTLAGQLAVKDKAFKDETTKLNKEKEQLQGVTTVLTQTVESLRVRKNELEADSGDNFENPDGKIQWVNQRQRLVWINLGLADGLGRQTTFAVFDRDQAGIKTSKPKARIEVLQIKDEHTAECRILEDKVANPILPGDLIHTPAWQPGQKMRFALVGFMDINKDGVSDRELIKNVISMNGGLIDAELKDDGLRTQGLPGINVNTRYLVVGDRPNDKTNQNILKEYSIMVDDASRYGVETISVQKLLNLMGWKVEEKTLNLGKGKDLSAFKGKKTETPAADTATEEAMPTETPKKKRPPPEDDPFK